MTNALLAVLSSCVVTLVASCGSGGNSENPLGPNAACYVCHMTFVGEELSQAHLKKKITCIRCHGPSAAHANDENIGATKPDKIFRADEINEFCRPCHKRHNVEPEKVVAEWQSRLAAGWVTKETSATVTCTMCHGHHRIEKEAAP